MRGSQFFSRKIFPQIFWAQAIIRGQMPSVWYERPSTFPVKPPETPAFRPSPSKGHNPSTDLPKGPQIGPFHAGSPWALAPQLAPQLAPIPPKIPRFQHFLAHKKCFPRDFRDQKCDFARLSCIGKGLLKNMARILRGVKGSLAHLHGGGGCLWSCGVPLWPCLALPCLASFILCRGCVVAFLPWGIFGRVPWGFLEHCNFWPLLGSLLACMAFSRVGCGFGWVGGFWGLVGLFCVVILFACVPCPPAKGKNPFLSLSLFVLFAFLACFLPSLSLQGLPCLSVSIYEKRNGLLCGSFLFVWVVGFGFSY